MQMRQNQVHNKKEEDKIRKQHMEMKNSAVLSFNNTNSGNKEIHSETKKVYK